MISLADAQHYVLSSVRPATPTILALNDARGAVLAGAIVADEAVPPFANTAMDGYAVRAIDTVAASPDSPVELPVVATLAAGASSAGMSVGPGEAIRIMTGAPMPEGADSVVPVENTERDSPDAARVRIMTAARAGDAVRPAGEDVAIGQRVFEPGVVLTPGHLGVLASLGRSVVQAFPRARVGVLSTGDELVSPPAPLGPGQIRDSNRFTLLALLAEAGCEPVDLGLARDDDAAIESAIRQGVASCDALVTSGGVSMGDFDWVKVVLDRLAAADPGSSMQWMQVAIKPAKPLAFGVISGCPIFGLPGNPVSSMVSFELFARPALRKMMGHPEPTWHRPAIKAIADEPLRRSLDGKTHFARVVAEFAGDGRLHVRFSGGQASNLLRSMALANALAILPDGGTVDVGAEVGVLLF